MEIPLPLLDTLRAAKHVVVLTGAGISVESGLSTFRTPQSGLWERFDAEDLATQAAFKANPALVWGWYEWRRMKALRAAPNEGHLAIRRLAQKVPQLTLITQNVDDLHERAGSVQSFICMALCIIPFATPVAARIVCRLAFQMSLKAAGKSSHRAAVTAGDESVRVLSGLVRTCRKRSGLWRSAQRSRAISSSASERRQSSSRPRP